MKSLLQHFEQFLKMCKRAGITLNPAKVRIGYQKEQFFGLTVENGKITPAERNLDPVAKMTTPKSRAELASVMCHGSLQPILVIHQELWETRYASSDPELTQEP